MPAYNAGRFIAQAIRSVLEQQGVDLELVVVDDASTDDTAAVVASIADPRLRLLRNDRRRGIGACHNIVLRASRARYIAHVDADDFILPGALRKMIDALAADANAGQAHCYFFDVDAEGRTTRSAFRRRWRDFHRGRRPDRDYRQALRTSSIANHLRTYPRAVLERLGGFDETLPYAVDYDAALRVVDRHTIKLVPEFLYVRRVHGSNTTEGLPFNATRMWAMKYAVRRRLVESGRVSFLQRANVGFVPFARSRWWELSRSVSRRIERAARRIRWRLVAPALAWLYRSSRRALAGWPLDWRAPKWKPSPAPSVAYYLRSFPVLSETFIQREVAELMKRGLPVQVIAEQAQRSQHFDELARRMQSGTHYLGAIEGQSIRDELRLFLRLRPLMLAHLFVYAVARKWAPRKTYGSDVALWRRAVRLAAVLRRRGITHLHAPWATPNEITALLAARLAGIPYSVQARASDIHRTFTQTGLDQRLGHAEFIVTNAHYNVPVIRSKLPPGVEKQIHVIYEGIDPSSLEPLPRRAARGEVPLVLSVSRLVEPKGLDVLMRACRILRDEGRALRCEIIGGTERSEVNHSIALKKLHRALDLENEVHFLGSRSFAEVKEKYAETDVYVLAARQAPDGRRDVSPNTLMEAMAMELPIVSSFSGAIPELIEDGVSGLLVPPNDEKALAAAIARLLDDPELGRRLGAAARRRVEEKFDITRNATRYAELFGLVPTTVDEWAVTPSARSG
jgi:glycosyltransferase involved in cell wall biosynthesis